MFKPSEVLPSYRHSYLHGVSESEALAVLQDFRALGIGQLQQQWLRFIINGGRDTLEEKLHFCILSGVAGLLANHRNQFGETALMRAAENALPAIVKMLLSIPGIDVNAADHEGNTALSLALGGSDRDSDAVVRLLQAYLGHDGDGVELLSRRQWMAHLPQLQAQAGEREPGKVSSHPADGNHWSGSDRSNFRSMDEHPAPPQSLSSSLSASQDARSQPDTDELVSVASACSPTRMALYQAERKRQWIRDVIPGNLVALDCFLERGLVPELINACDLFGRTALMCAVLKCHTDMVERLLGVTGIDLNLVSRFGESALSLAVMMRHTALVQLLLACPQLDPNQGGPVPVALYNRQSDMLDILLQDPRIDLHAPNRFGVTPLELAMHVRNIEGMLKVHHRRVPD